MGDPPITYDDYSPGLETHAPSPPDLDVMGVVDTWGEEDTILSSDYPIPSIPIALPPPPSPIEDGSPYGAPYCSPSGPTYGPDFPSDIMADSKVCDGSPGLCGFKNLGNTCFMSAGLQCLLNTPCLVQYFLDRQSYWNLLREKNDVGLWSLLEEFSVLVGKIWSKNYDALYPSRFKEILGDQHPQFKDFRQHDCQEFLTLLLDSLHEQLNRVEDMREKTIQPQEVAELGLKVSHCESSRSSQCSSPRSSESLNSEIPISSRLQAIPDSLRCIEEELPSSNIISTLNCDTPDLNNQTINETTGINRLEDILKDAKTPNINVLATPEAEMNNQLKFDSEKFTKPDNSRPLDSIYNTNLAEFYNFDSKSAATKKLKETNVLYDRTKCRLSEEPEVACVKRRRLIEGKEKNIQMEFQRRLAEVESSEESMSVEEAEGGAEGAPSSPSSLQDEMEADQHWDKYLAVNSSVVVDSFQGQFKSTVVCAVCGHVSVTFEPFMYLSVPLPRAMERQIVVTLVRCDGSNSMQYLLALNKHDKAIRLKEELRKMANIALECDVVLAEVFDNHIARTLEDGYMLRYINDVNRNVFAFEISSLNGQKMDSGDVCSGEVSVGSESEGACGIEVGEKEGCSSEVRESASATTNQDSGDAAKDGWWSCTICLEELSDADLLVHASCSCKLCNNCIDMSLRHHGVGNSLTCPVCNVITTPTEDFVPATSVRHNKPKTRLLDVPVVFRVDTLPEGDNSKRSYELFEHPRMLRLPSSIESSKLYEIVGELCESYKLRLVDGQGYHCSRCIYTAHCRGCEVPSDIVNLQPVDTLAVVFTHLPTKRNTITQHASMNNKRGREPLTVYDCLRAFSQSETLDSGNPWFCPKCQRNQCATKTLGVWRFPPIVMVYLKRFVFYEGTSLKIDDKVIFPLNNLDLLPYLVGPHSGVSYHYNLYAAVCHFGGTSAGHYTAYTCHPVTGEWHYFNDEAFSKQRPQEEDYSNTYILFYQRAENQHVLSVPEKIDVVDKQNYRPNIDVLITALDASIYDDDEAEARS